MKPKGKEKIIVEIKKFIKDNKVKANKNFYDSKDDLECYKMIYALSELFRVSDKHIRNHEEVEKMIDDLWCLYYYFKENIDGNKINYTNIVNRYSMYEEKN